MQKNNIYFMVHIVTVAEAASTPSITKTSNAVKSTPSAPVTTPRKRLSLSGSEEVAPAESPAVPEEMPTPTVSSSFIYIYIF